MRRGEGGASAGKCWAERRQRASGRRGAAASAVSVVLSSSSSSWSRERRSGDGGVGWLDCPRLSGGWWHRPRQLTD